MPTCAAVSGHCGCRRILVCAGDGVVLVGGGTVPMRAYEGPPGISLGRVRPGGPCRARRRCAHGRGGRCPGRGPACRGRTVVSGLWWFVAAVGLGPDADLAGGRRLTGDQTAAVALW